MFTGCGGGRGNGARSGRGSGRGNGRNGGQGFGFRGSSPAWPYVGRGRGGLPRCAYYAAPAARLPRGYNQEPADLNKRAAAVRGRLEELESRIQDIEAGT